MTLELYRYIPKKNKEHSYREMSIRHICKEFAPHKLGAICVRVGKVKSSYHDVEYKQIIFLGGETNTIFCINPEDEEFALVGIDDLAAYEKKMVFEYLLKIK